MPFFVVVFFSFTSVFLATSQLNNAILAELVLIEHGYHEWEDTPVVTAVLLLINKKINERRQKIIVKPTEINILNETRKMFYLHQLCTKHLLHVIQGYKIQSIKKQKKMTKKPKTKNKEREENIRRHWPNNHIVALSLRGSPVLVCMCLSASARTNFS